MQDVDQPNFQILAELFPEAEVPVALCSTKEFNDQERVKMRMIDFVKKISEATENEEILYLKDWHLVKQFPNYHAYDVPLFFADDWINRYWDELSKSDDKKDDYRFVYIGKKNSFTPLHCDVFRSFSWSSNVVGVKKW